MTLFSNYHPKVIQGIICSRSPIMLSLLVGTFDLFKEVILDLVIGYNTPTCVI